MPVCACTRSVGRDERGDDRPAVAELAQGAGPAAQAAGFASNGAEGADTDPDLERVDRGEGGVGPGRPCPALRRKPGGFLPDNADPGGRSDRLDGSATCLGERDGARKRRIGSGFTASAGGAS